MKILLESRKEHPKTKKPFVLLIQEEDRYFVQTLNYAGSDYEQMRKGGKYSELESYERLRDADNNFRMMCLRYSCR